MHINPYVLVELFTWNKFLKVNCGINTDALLCKFPGTCCQMFNSNTGDGASGGNNEVNIIRLKSRQVDFTIFSSH